MVAMPVCSSRRRSSSHWVLPVTKRSGTLPRKSAFGKEQEDMGTLLQGSDGWYDVTGDADHRHIAAIPRGGKLKISGDLGLAQYSRWKSLPRSLIVAGSFLCQYSNIKHLPTGLTVGRNLI
jgi:hypothetical protein